MSADIRSLIHQYARVGFYRYTQTVCDEVIRKKGNDPVLNFWRAYGSFMEGEERFFWGQ
jgi:tetratricopeptide repeat protein 21B